MSNTNPWNMGRGSWKDNMPLGWDAEQFILDNCQWVLYLRKDDRFFCREHWDWETKSVKLVNSYCSTCLGFGYKTEASIVPSRVSLGPVDVSSRNSDQRLPPGFIEYFTSFVHFPRKVRPNLEDLVLIGEWDTPTQKVGEVPRARVMNVSSIYVIKQINDRFERELAFYSCGLESAESIRSKVNLIIPYLQNVPILQTEDVWANNSYW